MYDLDRLAWPAEYTMAQASSYDRAAKSPTENWFANGDNGQYLRTEEHEGRKEHVMADLKGPGSVMRIWSANPGGQVRFYFDGEEKPRLEANLSDLLHGKVAGLGEPFSYEAARGCNLYYPLPYSKSLKITVDESANYKGLYYHVGFRTFPAGTPVETLNPSNLPSDYSTPPDSGPNILAHKGGTLKPNESISMVAVGPATIRGFSVDLGKSFGAQKLPWDSPKAGHNLLGSAVLTIEADGETTVVAPLGDFFCSSPGVVPAKSVPFEVTRDGLLVCSFPMPFAKELKFRIENRGKAPFRLDMKANVRPTPDVAPYRFHAQWSYYRGSTRPMRDLTFMDATGQGRFVGTYLHIENPTPGWWGEGDEKVFVDGESFPSTFGTGTEDYFGYAWSNPELFQRPFHGQPRCDGPGTFGHDIVYRWQIFDDIPYTKSLKFDLEMWHWAEVEATWSRVAYWYAAPGGTGNHPIEVKLPTEMAMPKPVAGAIEGENLKVIECTGGTNEVQDGFWEISGQKQRWWIDAKAGDRLALSLPVAKSGRYELFANMCHARDYGIHEIRLEGTKLAEIDFYSDGLKWEKVSLGVVDLKKGNARLEIVCRGANGKAEPRGMFGLDYLMLKAQ